MRLVFLGSGAFGVPCLLALESSLHDLRLVVSRPDRPAGRRKLPTPTPVAAAARERGLPLYQPESVNRREARSRLAAEHPDVLVVASFGQILKPALLELPRLGCVNVHGSLLPRHRGAACIAGAIESGDTESGVTIILMDAGLDSGPVLRRERVALEPRETAGSLHDRLAALAPGALLAALEELEAGRARPVPQNEGAATWRRSLTKEEACIAWDLDARQLDRRIRALTPWPGAFTWLPRREGPPMRLLVEQAEVDPELAGAPGEVVRAEGGELSVACGAGGLRLLRVKPAGRASMDAGSFLRGHPLRTGDRMQEHP